jgi:inner membrane protein
MDMFILIFIAIIAIILLAMFFVARFIYSRLFQNKNNDNMENSKTKITHSLTFKGIAIVVLILLLLIPGAMIQDLIKERENRSKETILRINNKWSLSQTVCAPLLAIPYTTTMIDKDKKTFTEEHTLYLTPKELNIFADVTPEIRYYGIYKAVLYKSQIKLSGNFSSLKNLKIDDAKLHFNKAFLALGVTDLRGIAQMPDVTINNNSIETAVGDMEIFDATEEVIKTSFRKFSEDIYSYNKEIKGKTLIINLKEIINPDSLQYPLAFNCDMKLNGSSSINFIPLGQTTSVNVDGAWQSPSFTGNFTPEYSIDKKQFKASWNVLSFNRNIPEFWSDSSVSNFGDNSFGVNLIETVDHYQQNMRSAKYALMFITLTFIVFFFVEIFTKKPIHFIQYLLVGVALILFYSLLLSFSEQIGFAWSYLIASIAIISLITFYAGSIFKQKIATIILAGVLIALYAFLYIILQLENLALLFGSVFLFLSLGIIMFASNKIKLNHD